MRIGFPVQINQSADRSRACVFRVNREGAVQDGGFFWVTPQHEITKGDLLQSVEVARVELERTLEISQSLLLFTSSSQNIAGQFYHPWIVRQSATCYFQFRQSPIVIEMTAIKIFRPGEVGLPGLGPEAEGGLNRRFRQSQARGRVLAGDKQVELVMRVGELAISAEK